MSAARYTLAAPATLAQEVRKSKFVAHAAGAATAQDAQAFVERTREAGATHNCWAWRIGQQYRFSDDGEPGGTAGRPILAAIDAQECDNLVVVVTRWFGGIKLGAGGLARAYGGCAAQCLRQAAKTPILHLSEVEFALPFAALPLLRARLAEFGANSNEERFDADGATLRLTLPAERIPPLRDFVRDLTRGRGEVRNAAPAARHTDTAA